MRYLLATAAAVLLTATPANAAVGEPTQCRTDCVLPSHPRVALISEIRTTLPPTGKRWSVYCSPNNPRLMYCWARNPNAKYTRRYTAAIFQGGYDLAADGPWSMRGLKNYRGTAR